MEDNFSTKEFVENKIGYFEYIENMTKLMTLGYIYYQKLQTAGDAGREMIAFTDGNKWYKAPYTKEMYATMAMINSTKREEDEIKKFIFENIKDFHNMTTLKEFSDLGAVIYENLNIAKDGNDEYVAFSVGDKWYKIRYIKTPGNDLYTYLKSINDAREEEKELNDYIKENLNGFISITTQEQLNALGNPYYSDLRVVNCGREEFIIFRAGTGTEFYKVPYNRNQRPDPIEAYIQSNQAKRQAVVIPPTRDNAQNGEAR